MKDIARKVLQIESEAISALISRLDDGFDRAVDLLANCRGRVVTTGMGKSGLICRKIAATMASTGTPALFLHPAEALHGDLGMLAQGDVVLALSNGGETEELVKLLGTLKRLGIPLISMVGDKDSTLGRGSEVALDVSVDQEACPFGLAPTASTTAALALGDALAIVLSGKKGFRLEDFARLHPGGQLGKRLCRVSELMHSGDRVPAVTADASMDDVIYEMSRKGLGVTSVLDQEGRLLGVISDGDLRRLLQRDRDRILSRSAGECMTKNPMTISENELATAALNLLEQRKITSLMVTDSAGRLTGVIHLHDLWGTQMF
ncbi:MAG: KpsF/GutQ family sugar-phosphate isomerase [Acidobacteriota bacterium]